jgi:hypothetical protein
LHPAARRAVQIFNPGAISQIETRSFVYFVLKPNPAVDQEYRYHHKADNVPEKMRQRCHFLAWLTSAAIVLATLIVDCERFTVGN